MNEPGGDAPRTDLVDLDDAGEPLETLLTRDPAELAGHKEKPEAAARGRELLSLYLRDIAKVPLLTPDEEQELARRVQAGEAAAERRLTEANLRLVVRVARRYLHRGYHRGRRTDRRPVDARRPSHPGEQGRRRRALGDHLESFRRVDDRQRLLSRRSRPGVRLVPEYRP